MKNLERLLENYWILKDEEKDIYYSVKDSLPEYKNFLNEKLGYQLIVNSDLIKLEKLPGKAESWMGIQEFDSNMEYVFLCLILMFLEDKEREEQFILSSITEFIQGNFPETEKVDWTLFKHRRSLIKTLRFVTNIGIIKLNDGDEQNFANDENEEVLYENTGISRYFVRNFNTNILDYSSYKDFEKEDLDEAYSDRGVLRRHRVYRRLLMSPVVYNEGLDDADYAYIKNFRNVLENDFDKTLNIPLHVHKNGASLVLPESHIFKDVFPNNKAISDIVLQLNLLIRDNINNNSIILGKDDTATVSIVAFEGMTRRLRDENSRGWSKEYRDMDLDNLVRDIINYMKGFNMLQELGNGREVRIMPLTGKLTGSYSDNLKEKMEENMEVE